MNPNASLITGVICGHRIEEIEDEVMQRIRWLDKLVDELAKGKNKYLSLTRTWLCVRKLNMLYKMNFFFCLPGSGGGLFGGSHHETLFGYYGRFHKIGLDLTGKGVNCLYPCGTTGEMLNMTCEERELVAETMMKAAAGRVIVYIHAGARILKDTVRLARHAERIGGVSGLSLLHAPMRG